MDPPLLELADIVRVHGDAFRDQYGGSLTAAQHRALHDVAACGTADLGGHVFRCQDCGTQRIAYNSCRNRHCPRCQGAAQADWLAQQADLLLPIAYHHLVFTLPAPLRDLPPVTRPVLYELLFRAAADTVQTVAADPRYLGATVGLTLVLHTWGQNLQFHPHVHGLVTGGGLACDTAGGDAPPRWVDCRPGFFLPVRVLSRVFRERFLDELRAAQARTPLAGVPVGVDCERWLAALGERDWVVFSQPAPGPEVVLKYLARYVQRVALSNRRLVDLDDDRVTFTVKDYAAGGTVKPLTLSAVEFLRRWVQHVLPKGFVKIRHYGFLANRVREANLRQCRRLLWPRQVQLQLTAATPEPPVCPCCGGHRWTRVGEVPRGSGVPQCAVVEAEDSS